MTIFIPRSPEIVVSTRVLHNVGSQWCTLVIVHLDLVPGVVDVVDDVDVVEDVDGVDVVDDDCIKFDKHHLRDNTWRVGWALLTRAANDPSVFTIMEKAPTCFQSGEGPSRGLLHNFLKPMDRLQHYYSPRRRVPVSVASLGRGQTSTVVLRSRGSAQAHTKTLGAARSRRGGDQRSARRCRDPRASGAGKRRFCPPRLLPYRDSD